MSLECPGPRDRVYVPILDRYLAKLYFKALLGVLAVLVAGSLWWELVEDLARYAKLPAATALGLPARHFFFSIPILAYLYFPLVALVAGVVTILSLARKNELAAIELAGRSRFRTGLPFVVVAACAGLVLAGVRETAFLGCNAELDSVKRVVDAGQRSDVQLFMTADRSEYAWADIAHFPPALHDVVALRTESAQEGMKCSLMLADAAVLGPHSDSPGTPSGTGVPPVKNHGQDVHATEQAGTCRWDIVCGRRFSLDSAPRTETNSLPSSSVFAAELPVAPVVIQARLARRHTLPLSRIVGMRKLYPHSVPWAIEMHACMAMLVEAVALTWMGISVAGRSQGKNALGAAWVVLLLGLGYSFISRALRMLALKGYVSAAPAVWIPPIFVMAALCLVQLTRLSLRHRCRKRE